MRTEWPCSSSQHRNLPSVAFTNTRSPTAGSLPAGPNHSACQNKPRFFRVNFKRNIRLSFALRSRAAQLSQPSRSWWTWLLEPFTRGGLSCFSRELWHPPVASTGPATLDRRCKAERSRSGGIFQEVFLRSNRTLSGQKPARDRPADAREVGFRRPGGHRPRRCQPLLDIVAPAAPDLHYQGAARRQQPPGLWGDQAVGVEAVGAAIQRAMWIVI